VSASGLRLVPLRCPACASGLQGHGGGVLLYCPGCAGGYELSVQDALEPVPVSFAVYTPGSASFHPFWVFDATLTLDAREAKRSLSQLLASSTGMTRLFQERERLDFYSPGFASDIDSEQSWGLHLTREQPRLASAGRQPALEAVTLSQADARAVAEHLFLVSEIEQPDVVRDLQYTLQLANPRVVAIAL
jgi:hypothetical protein